MIELLIAIQLEVAMPEPIALATIHAQIRQIADTESIAGLISVTKYGTKKWYHYKTSLGNEVALLEKKTGIPDLRSYNERHPVRNAVQKAASRWESSLGAIATVLGGAAAAKSMFGGRLF